MCVTPGRFDLDLGIAGEQCFDPGLLFVGEQVDTGVQGPPRGVERITLVSAVAVDDLLDPAAALIQCIAGQADDVERIMPTSA